MYISTYIHTLIYFYIYTDIHASQVTDLVHFRRVIDELWTTILTKGQINKFATTDHDLTMKEFATLKLALRTWRFGDVKVCVCVCLCMEFDRSIGSAIARFCAVYQSMCVCVCVYGIVITVLGRQ